MVVTLNTELNANCDTSCIELQCLKILVKFQFCVMKWCDLMDFTDKLVFWQFAANFVKLWQGKNLENQPIFDEVMCRILWNSLLFGIPCILCYCKVSVWSSVCLSLSSIVSKRLNVSSNSFTITTIIEVSLEINDITKFRREGHRNLSSKLFATFG